MIGFRNVSSATAIAHCHEKRPLSWLKRYEEFMEACDTVNMWFRKPFYDVCKADAHSVARTQRRS